MTTNGSQAIRKKNYFRKFQTFWGREGFQGKKTSPGGTLTIMPNLLEIVSQCGNVQRINKQKYVLLHSYLTRDKVLNILQGQHLL